MWLLGVGACEKPPVETGPNAPTGVEGSPGAGAAAPGAGAAEGAAADEMPTPGPEPEPGTTPSSPSKGERFAIVPQEHALHERLEAPDMPNACTDDTGCHVGGCNGEVCSSEPGVVTTCEVLPIELPPGSSCGCVEGSCQWWHPEGAALIEKGISSERPEPRTNDAPTDALAECGGKTCKPGQECITYYGIAGPRGPRFRSCEWRCRRGQPNDGCPPGTKCVTVADGPGRVCR